MDDGINPALAAKHQWLEDRGLVVMTTNRIVIWMNRDGSSAVIRDEKDNWRMSAEFQP